MEGNVNDSNSGWGLLLIIVVVGFGLITCTSGGSISDVINAGGRPFR
jgi:hypothetical protein